MLEYDNTKKIRITVEWIFSDKTVTLKGLII